MCYTINAWLVDWIPLIFHIFVGFRDFSAIFCCPCWSQLWTAAFQKVFLTKGPTQLSPLAKAAFFQAIAPDRIIITTRLSYTVRDKKMYTWTKLLLNEGAFQPWDIQKSFMYFLSPKNGSLFALKTYVSFPNLIKSVHQSLDLIEQFVPETPRLNRIRLNRDYCYVVMRSKVWNFG